MFLLLNVVTEITGAVDNTKGSSSEKSSPKNKLKTEEAELPHTKPASFSQFLGKLLVVPMDGSHWVGLKAIAQEMGRRGHRVTVVMPETTVRMGPGKHYDTLTYPVPYDKAYIDSVMSTHKDIMKRSAQPFMEKIKKRFTQVQVISDFLHITAEKLLFNASLISHLAQQVSTNTEKENNFGISCKTNIGALALQIVHGGSFAYAV